jgi:hypothetical protein
MANRLLSSSVHPYHNKGDALFAISVVLSPSPIPFTRFVAKRYAIVTDDSHDKFFTNY